MCSLCPVLSLQCGGFKQRPGFEVRKIPLYQKAVTSDFSLHCGHFAVLDQALFELFFLFLCKVNINNGFAVLVTPQV